MQIFKLWGLGSVAIAICILGCSSPAISNEPTSASPSPPTPKPPIETKAPAAPKLIGTPQYLQIGAIVNIGNKEIQLEVAATPLQQQKGLMFRPPLAQNRGMLFPFNPPRPVAFWMKNTPSPLDMIFILDGRVQAIAENATLCQQEPCPIYPEGGVVADNVIEVRSGLTRELGLKVGDQITIKYLLPKNQ